MNELHLFAGAGGGILGGMLLGHTCVCAVEIEPYPRKVLLQRQRDGILPKFPLWDDVTTFDGRPWQGKVDVVCGGFPCQDISAAGKGAGLNGERSGLWSEMRRIISEVGPRFVFVENSPMLTLRGLGTVLGELAEMGYDASWGVLGNDSVNGWCKRERIWILAGSSKDGFHGSKSERNTVRPQKVHQNKPDYTNRIWGEAGGCLSIGDWKEFASKFCRMDDGLDNRLDRISAIGNGQVPALAALAWKVLGGP